MPPKLHERCETTLARTSARAQLRRMRWSCSHTRHHRTGQRQAGMDSFYTSRGFLFRLELQRQRNLKERTKRCSTKISLFFPSFWGQRRRGYIISQRWVSYIIFFLFSFFFMIFFSSYCTQWMSVSIRYWWFFFSNSFLFHALGKAENALLTNNHLVKIQQN